MHRYAGWIALGSLVLIVLCGVASTYIVQG